jgi:hypothetical protein
MGSRVLAMAAALALVAGAAQAETILFVGNSFTYGANSPVWKYRAGSVTDLNGTGVGGVPALFKLFAQETGRDFSVSLETSGGKDLGFHLREKGHLVIQRWDHVVMQGYSTLDPQRPGDPAALIRDSAAFAQALHERNPAVDIRLSATWSRADQTYLPHGRWYGRPIKAMAVDVRVACEQAMANSRLIKAVIPIGDAWNLAFDTGFADADPYDGIEAGKVDLWAWDSYHASALGYYLEALTIFGSITGLDPRVLGAGEVAAAELGISPRQAATLQLLAHETLSSQTNPALRSPASP